MNDGALYDTLKARGRLRVFAVFDNETRKFVIHVVRQLLPEQIHIDVAGAHDGCRVLVVHQGKQQVFERGIFMIAIIRERKRAVKAFFQTA